jgi:hypothetical protein
VKSLTGSILATVLGLALLAVGVAGVAGAFEKDEDDGGGDSSSSLPSNDCPTDDPRIEGGLETFDVKEGVLIVKCETGIYEATYGLYSGTVTEPHTLALWLARGRKKYALVGARQVTYGDSVGVGGPLPRNTTRYDRWIVSREPEEVTEPRRPTKIIEAVEF